MATLEKKRTEAAAGQARLSEQAYTSALQAMLWANRRIADYWRAVWEINSGLLVHPSSDRSDRESLERVGQVHELTVREIDAQRQEAAKLTEQLAEQAMAVNEPSLAVLSGVLDTAMAHLNVVKDATASNSDQPEKRLALR
jgi:hypothetical protein